MREGRYIDWGMGMGYGYENELGVVYLSVCLSVCLVFYGCATVAGAACLHVCAMCCVLCDLCDLCGRPAA